MKNKFLVNIMGLFFALAEYTTLVTSDETTQPQPPASIELIYKIIYIKHTKMLYY
jgi:hypothetical protein